MELLIEYFVKNIFMISNGKFDIGISMNFYEFFKIFDDVKLKSVTENILDHLQFTFRVVALPRTLRTWDALCTGLPFLLMLMWDMARTTHSSRLQI